MAAKKTLLVSGIEHGTVIDHIPAGQALKIVQVLNYAAHDKLVALGLNLDSKKMKKKDLIKVAERELSPRDASYVALFAPNASINIIRDYEVLKKLKLKLPDQVTHLLVCPNPKCITNHEARTTCFYLTFGEKVKVRCKYCERTLLLDDIKAYNVLTNN